MEWAPCPVDRVLRDGDEVKLGGTTLVARLTPGHTKGCTTWTLTAEEGGKKYRVVIVGSVNVNPGFRLVHNARYPEIAADFARTFQVLASLPCDIFLGSHGVYYGMKAKYERSLKEGVRAFVDPEAYRRFIEAGRKAYLAELAKQRGE
jgi:metallo-beta-lactamase class B